TLTMGVIAPTIIGRPRMRSEAEPMTANDVIRPGAEWTPQPPDGFTDVGYDTSDGIARITIRRPEVRNAFRPRTLFELRDAFELARDYPDAGVVILPTEGAG